MKGLDTFAVRRFEDEVTADGSRTVIGHKRTSHDNLDSRVMLTQISAMGIVIHHTTRMRIGLVESVNNEQHVRRKSRGCKK